MNNIVIKPRYTSYSLPIINDFKPRIDLQDSSLPYNQECLIDAHNDLQAVQSWLAQYSDKNTTFVRYKIEADRFLLWCIYEAGKSLSQLKVEDFTKYIEFLGNTPAIWCTSVGEIRVSGNGKANWRPFVGALSNSAKSTAIKIVNSLMNYLVDAIYLRANPLKLIKQKSKFDIKSEENKYNIWSKILDDQEWQAVQQTLQDLPENTDFEKDHKFRMQFIFACMYFLGLRISEFTNSYWNAFKDHQGAWWFFVRGKGDKLGHIPVNSQLLEIVKNYRAYLGKSVFPSDNETGYLIISKKTNKELSIKRIYNLIKEIGAQAAEKFAVDSMSYQKLLALSPHSLRHLNASHQSKAGVPMQIIKENAEDDARHASIQNLKIANISNCLVSNEQDEKILAIIIKKNTGMTKLKSLAAFIKAIEDYSSNGIRLKNVKSLDDILLEFDAVKKFGNEYVLHYLLDFSQLESIFILKEYICREADIRFLNVDVKFNMDA
jgi:site-specific recombinase XerD